MECTLVVPHGTDISVIEREYPDICDDEIDEDGDVYFIGNPSEEDEEVPWLDYDDAIAFCGFCEGAIAGANAIIDGNGEWAMGMFRTTDFSGYVVDDKTKKEWKRRSDIWHEAFERGKLSR